MKKAFTLIELLVVLAIISMLAAFLLPALSTARERARRTTCVNNLRQFLIAYEMYADDHYEKFPDQQQALYIGEKSIYPYYIKTNKTFWCPSSLKRNLPPPNGDITENLSLDINGNPTTGNWADYRNQWYASYSFVFGLSTSNKSSRPVPLISDRGIYNTGNLSTYSNLSGSNPLTGNHPVGINSLYLEGNVEWIPLQNIDFSKDTPDPGAPKMGNVAARPNGYSVIVDDNPSGETTIWGEE